ncbi:hypothetical protein niasHT_006888 [Heterodera trifolii]|uniref:Uncharacterized protein n=1 Tax=Heterodera trifolii TaxID=157864 RepID=A0ABD2LMV2_9BILA
MASLTIKMASLFLLALCIGIAIEQTQAFYGWGAYDYAYPYGGWYGKRQAGFGPSASVGTFGNGRGGNANGGGGGAPPPTNF